MHLIMHLIIIPSEENRAFYLELKMFSKMRVCGCLDIFFLGYCVKHEEKTLQFSRPEEK